MIPKTIHYCWFGGNDKSEKMLEYIESWKQHCPDYQIMEWNESNYDVTKHPFMEKAYAAKKWAFVSDYARIDILHEHGGIYLDTDVELLTTLDPFLGYDFFAGFENEEYVAFGLGFGSVAGHPILKDIMAYYDHTEFPDSSFLLPSISCPIIQTNVLKRYGLVCNNLNQEIRGGQVFSTEYFCPMSYETGETHCTERTVSIHHYDISWASKEMLKRKHTEWKMVRVFGPKLGKRISAAVSVPRRIAAFPKKMAEHMRNGSLTEYFKFLLRRRKHD